MPVCRRGIDALLHELGPSGRVEQRLGTSLDVQGRILDELADPLREGNTAGLAQELDGLSALGDPRREARGQGRLARAVQPLDRDQPGAGHALTVAPGRLAGGSGGVAGADSRIGAMSPTATPDQLPGIAAHPHARAILEPAIAPGGRPAHAYLFQGPPGTGKRTIARAFAAALLAGEPGDRDAVAARIARACHPDLTWVAPSGAAEMLVSDIDEPVVSAATRTPFESSRRVFVLESAQTMSDQVANRLLKTLEEPPPFVHLILLTDRPQDMLATVASRCQAVRFDPLAPGLIERDLLARGVEPDEARACARLARGDSTLAAALTEEPGRALRACAESFVRAALAGRAR